MTDWQPVETAPKRGNILLRFGRDISVAYWDEYYAEGGAGCTNGIAWIEPCSGEQLSSHFGDGPDGWMPLPKTPKQDQ